MVRSITDKTDKSKKPLTLELQTIANKLIKVTKYPGIILVVVISEIIDDIKASFNFIPEDDVYEHPISFKIPPWKIYIRKDDGTIISILSREADEYVKTIISTFETKEEEQRIAGERGRFLEEKRKEARTITEKFKDPITKTISFASKDWQIDLLIGDIEASNPEYLQLRTWNQEDLFNFVIINDEIRVNGFTESNDIIIQKLEFLEPIKDILSVMFNKIFNTIKIDRKIYYSNKIKEVFKYLTLS